MMISAKTRNERNEKGKNMFKLLPFVLLFFYALNFFFIANRFYQIDGDNSDRNIGTGEYRHHKKNQQTLADKKIQGIKRKDKDQEEERIGILEVPLSSSSSSLSSSPKILTAYIEDIDMSPNGWWYTRPLSPRHHHGTASSSKLKKLTYPNANKSCRNLPSNWPTDGDALRHTSKGSNIMGAAIGGKVGQVLPTDDDPFLPWIHDVFPTADGKYIQFVAQNRRRCNAGNLFTEVKDLLRPNVALFQHIPLKRVEINDTSSSTGEGEQRFRLSSHEEADPDGIQTRFLCHFPSVNMTTLSTFNFNYDYHTFRKGYKHTFTEKGDDVHMIWSSQLLFQCPVPEVLVDVVRDGSSVVDDSPSIFFDLVPVRTPPRFGSPVEFLPPRLRDQNWNEKDAFNADVEFGKNHILPRIKDSGRWSNVPICKPSLMTYDVKSSVDENKVEDENVEINIENKHHEHDIVACTWTSASFETRGGRTQVSDGARRFREWVHFNRLVGVDHIYLYDNSGAFSNETSLKDVADEFPGYVTRIDWPSRVCNNNKGNGSNKGERSSQYAAESSCRLRFGSHSRWFASMDTDEYLIPLGQNKNLKDLVKKAEGEDIYILNFKSKRAKPRLDLLNKTILGKETRGNNCWHKCIDPSVPVDRTFLETYNCDYERPVRKNVMPAEKQLYRTDYVLLHFVHYSTITVISAMGHEEVISAAAKDSHNSCMMGGQCKRRRNHPFMRLYKEQHVKYVDEISEATMLHTKSIVIEETSNWLKACKRDDTANCKLGIPFPPKSTTLNMASKLSPVKVDKKWTILKADGVKSVQVDNKWTANCFEHVEIDKDWVPLLRDAMGFKTDS